MWLNRVVAICAQLPFPAFAFAILVPFFAAVLANASLSAVFSLLDEPSCSLDFRRLWNCRHLPRCDLALQLAVSVRGHAEAVAKRLGEAALSREAYGRRYAREGLVSGFEHFAGALHAPLAHVPHGRHPLDFLEQAGELARAHACRAAEPLKRDGLAEIVAHVGASQVEGSAVGGAYARGVSGEKAQLPVHHQRAGFHDFAAIVGASHGGARLYGAYLVEEVEKRRDLLRSVQT